ncbi:DUF2339 domain-containing protein [Flexivirga sp. ID2601S]|uniref:DUF2339 domain-containing protein n=1 Tax=Flexivirga aerilata TaxID=1656889 RepID=A0A849AGV4_9MICO|nr:DUF2339 domain-containing protein [Flexivirga aerilata]NNG38796.1 DUF2339 domain-containing protein [Flexivirga aerilata]
MNISGTHSANTSTGFRQSTGAPPFAAPVPPAPPSGPAYAGFAGPTPPHRTPWWQRGGVVSKLLALTGGAVTLTGVVMLLVVVAGAGLLTPWVRVGGGVALSLLLVAGGLRVHGRPGGWIGGIALAATGIAGLFVSVVAVTSFYAWIPPAAGLALAGVVAAASVALALRWRSQLLAILVTVGVAALAPVLTDGLSPSLAWFLILLQAAGIVPERAHRWIYLGLVRTLPAALVAAAVLTQSTGYDRALAPLVVAALGLVSLVVSRGHDDDLNALGFAVAYLPLLAVLPQLAHQVALAVGLGAVAVTVAVAVVCRPLHVLRVAAVAGVTSIATVESVVSLTTGSWLPALLMVPAVTLTAVARQARSLIVAGVAACFAAAAVATYLVFAGPAALSFADEATAVLSSATMVGGLLLTVWAALAVSVVQRLGFDPRGVVSAVVGSIIGLYGVTAAVLSFGTAVGRTDGFHTGHLGVTVIWMAAAMSLLAVGLHLPAYAKVALGGGLLLAGAALGKLFLFDLATLSGATRAVTFIAVGLLLLFAGSRYAQAFARRGTSDIGGTSDPSGTSDISDTGGTRGPAIAG